MAIRKACPGMANVDHDELDDRTVSVLNHLIAVSNDAERFYEEAVERVESVQLHSIFRDMAAARHRMVQELTRLLADAGGEPTEHGTFVGGVTRLYARVEAALVDDDLAILIDHLKEAEARAAEEFRSALEEDLPPNVQEIVKRLHNRLEIARVGLDSVKPSDS